MESLARRPFPTATAPRRGIAPHTGIVPTVDRRDILRRVEKELARLTGRGETLVLTLPAASIEPERLLDLSPREPAFFWDPRGEEIEVGLGVARRLRASGHDRFLRLGRDAETVTRRLASRGIAGCSAPVPRFYGGLAFDAGAAESPLWDAFGDADFILPRFTYRRRGLAAELSWALCGEQIHRRADRHTELEALEEFLDTLAKRRPAEEKGTANVRRGTMEPPPRARLKDEIGAIRQAIRDGRFTKIVAAGRSRLALDAPPDPVTVLRRLLGDQDTGSETRFAARRGEATFLGATPERLVLRRGHRVLTEALAGSIGRGQGEELLRSAKDRHEHRLVVEAVLERLAPLCERLVSAPEPEIRTLRNVLHLHTPIAGHLARHSRSRVRHVLELVQSLHPTPAVGGVPTSGALAWIRENESEPRGWYAAPVGWFDANGDGELVVALRSALLTGCEAHVYAGAGIVAESDPDLEIREIELKQQRLLSVLDA